MVIGCSQGNLSQYEKDNPTISVKNIIPLRIAYNVSFDWLLLGVGDMFLPDTGVVQPAENTVVHKPVNAKKDDKVIKEINELLSRVQKKLREMKG